MTYTPYKALEFHIICLLPCQGLSFRSLTPLPIALRCVSDPLLRFAMMDHLRTLKRNGCVDLERTGLVIFWTLDGFSSMTVCSEFTVSMKWCKRSVLNPFSAGLALSGRVLVLYSSNGGVVWFWSKPVCLMGWCPFSSRPPSLLVGFVGESLRQISWMVCTKWEKNGLHFAGPMGNLPSLRIQYLYSTRLGIFE